MISNNINKQNYAVRSSTVKSYLTENTDGTLQRVEYYNDEIVVETYSSDYQLIKSGKIPMELSIWGGYYSGADYNFIVFGQKNLEESDQKEVVRVVRYSKDWERIDAVGVSAINTYIPFDAGSLRMVQSGDTLYIHTCHKMYTSDDGKNHQANMNCSRVIAISGSNLLLPTPATTLFFAAH